MKLALEQGPKGLRWIAPSATLITDGFLIIYQLGVCICYIVFVAKNLEQVSFNYSCQLKSIKNAVLDSYNLWLCMGCKTCDVGNVRPSFRHELSQESQSFSTILDFRWVKEFSKSERFFANFSFTFSEHFHVCRVGIYSLLCVPRSAKFRHNSSFWTNRKISLVLWNSFVCPRSCWCCNRTWEQYGNAERFWKEVWSFEYRNVNRHIDVCFRWILWVPEVWSRVKGQHHIKFACWMVKKTSFLSRIKCKRSLFLGLLNQLDCFSLLPSLFPTRFSAMFLSQSSGTITHRQTSKAQTAAQNINCFCELLSQSSPSLLLGQFLILDYLSAFLAHFVWAF